MSKYSLAFDFGATSIRAILGKIEGSRFETKEVMRMAHDRVEENGRSSWQWSKMLDAITKTIISYQHEINSIAFNTWGVDCGVLDSEGNLIITPVSYRDARHAEGFAEALKTLSAEEIFMLTGNQIMPINTLFQLLVFKKDALTTSSNSTNVSHVFDKIDKLLMLPDLFGYMLTGNIYNELTIASTSQLLDLNTHTFSKQIISSFKLKETWFSNIVMPSTIVGTLQNAKLPDIRNLNLDIPVIAVASHDTASAVLLTEAYTEPNTAFLSCGTWSLIGALSEKPVISKEAFDQDLTNESGFNGTNMFFKNITGLYILETLKKQLEEECGHSIDFKEITSHVENSKVQDVIDVDDPVFQQNDFDVRIAINNILGKSQKHNFDYFKIIYLSLAHKYQETLEHISKVLDRKFTKIHMIGGGTKSSFLCQLVANTLNMEVLAGPMEATAYGNLLAQKLALKEFANLAEARKFIIQNESITHYYPKPNQL